MTPSRRASAKAGEEPLGPGAATPRPSATGSPDDSATNGDPGFAIVGIGASAGGLAAFEQFFAALPSDTPPGMAFVLVQHLAPDHASLLPDLIRRATHLPVFEAEDGLEVRSDCVYVIPPRRDLAILNGRLQLLEPTQPRGQRLAIDYFFNSLAHDQRERAIGIVLSGTGSDGTLGLRTIKAEGGMVMAQTPESAEFDGMPGSAAATGLVDYVLPPAAMPAQLIAYARFALDRRPRIGGIALPLADSAMQKVFVLLRAQVGHDFSHYKPSTLHRRIARRMALHQLATIDAYVRLLQQSPVETESLFRDLLIGVTRFFRDAEAFKVLEEETIPRLFEGRPAGSVIRLWTVGCSTGEEAYSLAILVAEWMERSHRHYEVQHFATDIDARAVATARAGLYPASIAADVSAERLARFFTSEADGQAYRIKKSIRDQLIFSEQDLIRDPPFSRLDLLSCRNVLIYMDTELQKRLIPLFHYALRPDGVLFLGTSEGVGSFESLFDAVDRKAKIFRRRADSSSGRLVLPGRTFPAAPPPGRAHPHATTPLVTQKKPSLRQLTEHALLQQVASAGALVDAEGDILYLHGRTGMYLEPTPGEAGVSNILRMAREGLRRDLGATLRKAATTGKAARATGLRVRTNGHFTTVDVSVRPVSPGPGDATLYLVVLDEGTSAPAPVVGETLPSEEAPAGTPPDAEAHIAALTMELRAKEDSLLSANEELERANEELKSSSEEMQSVNEELQSTNEELETSKEEMQSVNEELSTVNTELQAKVLELTRANNDMNNLLAGTGVGTVFVDLQQRVLRFTPATTAIINLIPSDLGRPLAHIASNLVGYDHLLADVATVLRTLVPHTAEVQANDGRWFTMRVQPYRTLDNVIEGAVITFEDITALKQTEATLRAAAADLRRLAVVVKDARDAITVQDLEGRVLAWNAAAERMYGWTEAEALRMNVAELVPPALRGQALERMHRLASTGALEPYRTQRITKDGTVRDVAIITTQLVDETGGAYAISTTERVI